MPCPRLAARPARGGGQLVQRLLLLRAAQHPRKPPLRRRRTRLRHVENLRQQPRLRPQAGIRLSRRRGGLRPVERILRPGLSRFVERTDGHLALDRAGRTGLHAAAMANFAAILANRGYYYIPHIVKRIEGRDSIDRRFYEKQYTISTPNTSNRSSRECGAA